MKSQLFKRHRQNLQKTWPSKHVKIFSCKQSRHKVNMAYKFMSVDFWWWTHEENNEEVGDQIINNLFNILQRVSVKVFFFTQILDSNQRNKGSWSQTEQKCSVTMDISEINCYTQNVVHFLIINIGTVPQNIAINFCLHHPSLLCSEVRDDHAKALPCIALSSTGRLSLGVHSRVCKCVRSV